MNQLDDKEKHGYKVSEWRLCVLGVRGDTETLKRFNSSLTDRSYGVAKKAREGLRGEDAVYAKTVTTELIKANNAILIIIKNKNKNSRKCCSTEKIRVKRDGSMNFKTKYKEKNMLLNTSVSISIQIVVNFMMMLQIGYLGSVYRRRTVSYMNFFLKLYSGFF